jgi:transformation/transcription domain-associated protein
MRNDERLMQMYTLLNRMLDKYIQTRRRNVSFRVPIVVPLNNRQRLMSCDASDVTLEDVFEHHLLASGRESFWSQQLYRDLMRRSGQSETDLRARVRVFDEMCTHHIPDTILARYVAKVHPALDEHWAFKRQFATHLGVVSYMSYVFNVGDRAPHKISLSTQSGCLVNLDFSTMYNQSQLLDNAEPVPFRLTRNMVTFLTPFMIDGIMASVITSFTHCLIKNQEVIKHIFCLFLRDDLLSTHISKFPTHSDSVVRRLDAQLRDKVSANLSIIFKRFHHLSSPVPEQRGEGGAPPSINGRVHQVIRQATSKTHLAMMPATWLPWF